MPHTRRIRDRELHEMVSRGGRWWCTARNPRCGVVVDTFVDMLAHVTVNQPDRREEEPVPGLVTGPLFGGLEDVA